MKILFVHQNFPGQFKHLAPALAAQGHTVVAMAMRKLPVDTWHGVRIIHYTHTRASTPNIHPWLGDFETKVIRGEACYLAARLLRDSGFIPDVIIAHHGWGESMFLKEVWPRARIGVYCEFYYHAVGVDVNFDPEFPSTETGFECRMRLKNINNMLHFEVADGGISPTRWQASTFPPAFRSKISVVHDGIDTRVLVPNAAATLQIGENQHLSRQDEVITFVNRNLEPYRGYHIFMRALPELLKRRPNAKVLIVGSDDVSYGSRPEGNTTWKEIFINEVRPQISDEDWSRVHFLGQLPYQQFISLLQISSVHVYLTYPFVLSWSLLEAMSCGCAIVASDTAPLREAIRHGDTGRLVNFFDKAALVNEVSALLDDPAERSRLGARARAAAQQLYDLKTQCLPRQLQWVKSLLEKPADGPTFAVPTSDSR